MRVSHTASAVNYVQVTGAATTKAVIQSAQGSDSNISFVTQTKGTGAIDLAAGSSGVNISNGGTVTALTITTGGGLYTSLPTVAISAPTTAGGVQATASITLRNGGNPPIVSGGTGYTVGDTLTAVGGTFTVAATFSVTAVSGGVVTGVTATNQGVYTVPPSNPVSFTGGTGSGVTLTLNFIVGAIAITNAGSGYVEQPTVTFSGGGGSGAAAYATVGSGTTVKTLGSTLSFSTPSSEVFRITDANPSALNYLQVEGTGGGSLFRTAGASTNTSLGFVNKGTGNFYFSTSNSLGNIQFNVAHTASAVNYVQVTGAATGNSPSISWQGSDANIQAAYLSKGTGVHSFFSGLGARKLLQLSDVASSVNFLEVIPSATGVGVRLIANGSDTNIPLVLQPKGTGALQAQQTDSTATGGNARGANAVDWQTLRSTNTMVASGTASVLVGGQNNSSTNYTSFVGAGANNTASGPNSAIVSGNASFAPGQWSFIGSGNGNTAGGYYNFIGGGQANSATSQSAVTTQSGTMNGTTAVTLSGSNASIKVGQYISGTSISGNTYVAAISGTSLTLSQAASGSSTSTLSFYTPHGVVVGGGNNQATGSYSFIGGGGDAGTAANRNVASGDWSFVGGGMRNTASGLGSVVVGGGFDGTNTLANTASGIGATVVGGAQNTAVGLYATTGGRNNYADGNRSTVFGNAGSSRTIRGYYVFAACQDPIGGIGASQGALLIVGKQTTDATPTVLTSNGGAAGTDNQIILPNNSAYYFRGEVVSGVTGGGNTKGWFIEGVIKRGANAASTALVGTPTVTSSYADAGASTWTIAVTADTTNGGLAVTFTGQASTTIRTVAQIRTTEMTY
jgi:hypothetical protein